MKTVKAINIFIVSVFVTAFISGNICGKIILKSALGGNVNIFTFVFSQSQNFIDMFFLLNNSNDYKRLEGYYAYRESGLADLNFLYERYRSENSEIIRKAIIWVAEGNSQGEKLVDFYGKIYNISSEENKRFINKKLNKNVER